MKTLATALVVASLLLSCSQKETPCPSAITSQNSLLAKSMFAPSSSKRIIISTVREDTTSINYKVSQRWDKDCMRGSAYESLDDYCEK